MKETFREALIVCGIALLAATVSAFFHPKRPAWYKTESDEVMRWAINEEKASELLKISEVVWIDARSAKQFAEKHYPGAISLDLENWAELMFEQQERLQDAIGKTVVVYCDGTRCEKSQEVAKKLRELLGLDPVYLLKGNWRLLVPK
jgi:predicted sulfurtransferase